MCSGVYHIYSISNVQEYTVNVKYVLCFVSVEQFVKTDLSESFG